MAAGIVALAGGGWDFFVPWPRKTRGLAGNQSDSFFRRHERIDGEQPAFLVNPELEPIRQKRLEHQADLVDRGRALALSFGLQVVHVAL